jgi:hypothetical protein
MEKSGFKGKVSIEQISALSKKGNVLDDPFFVPVNIGIKIFKPQKRL